MPPVSLRTRLRIAGLLPWLLIAPSLLIQVAVLASAVSDAAFPWPEARLAIAERRPLVSICTSVTSRREYAAGELVAGVRTRGYALILPSGQPTFIVISQDLPDGRLAVTDDPGSLVFPLLALGTFVAGVFILVRRLFRASRVGSPGAIPPLPVPATAQLPGAGTPSTPPQATAFLYPAGYSAAWFALISWFGFFVFTAASIAPEGSVSVLHESPLVAALSLFFSLSLLASWALSIVLWVVLAQRRRPSVLTVVLLSCSGYLWSFAYLFAVLPDIRPSQPRRGA